MIGLPPGFVWGVATSAYQIEGAVDEDGRGPSIWDTFTAVPGAVADGASGAVACDHYHRWAEDLDLIAGLGAGAYRFSIAWPRVQPTGRGPANAKGLDFYKRLLDGMAERGIDAWATLYHWDLPQALEDEGGWRARDTALRFAEYAAILADSLGDRIGHWITLNEPYCSSITGYAEGRHAPGTREGHGALAAAHHLLLGHGLAVRELRQRVSAPVGVTLNMSPAVAATGSPADQAAARRQDLLVNRLFTEPLLGGRYPADAPEVWGDLTDFSFLVDGDLETVAAPLDFLGVNYYYRVHVRDSPLPAEGRAARSAYQIGVEAFVPEAPQRTGIGWPIEPEGLYATLTGLRERYPALPPIYITENGCAYLDEVGPDGRVDDAPRIGFTEAHLAAAARAIADGVDLRGYFHWSLLDNFEWARGYPPRFGLVHVDYDTQARTPKDSYHWLKGLING
ncbi:GH1 family beta-glucosidase [Luedemannella helvata]|uniref:Beta-glucosidase n=1 Tax=Luedemannella helvata TaxID=349315 RepID=A0ABP4X6F0_9ACTN